MLPSVNHISNLVKYQFPAFYREEGPQFIAFVEAYYEWMESSGFTLQKTRDLYENRDVDTTSDTLFKQFINKYMSGVPLNVLGDKRLLEKHILDVYRSKGSISGLKLFFRLLYNEDIDVYIPSKDILKPSDGIWKQRNYIEITDTPYNGSFDQKQIIGTQSGATAFVDNYSRIYINKNNKVVNVLYVSSVQGTFLPGEKVWHDGITVYDAPFIYGSPVAIDITAALPYQSNGTVIFTEEGIGLGLKGLISSTYDAGSSNGFISFSVTDGGSGFTVSPSVNVSVGANTTGAGANFTGVKLANTSLFTYNTNYIAPVTSKDLANTSYGATLNNTNLASLLSAALSFNTATIGTIIGFTGVSPGSNYDNYVNTHVRDNLIAGYSLLDANGNIIGDNAIIDSQVVLGTGIPNAMVVKNSGMGYNIDGEVVSFSSEANSAALVTGTIVLGGVGTTEGYWYTTQSLLDEDKYIQDSYYYQEYSYEIQISKSLDKYFEILREAVHPTGNEVFGKVKITHIDEPVISMLDFSVTQS